MHNFSSFLMNNVFSGIPSSKSAKNVSLNDALSILMTGFLRGATSFLKGEIIKGTSGVNREVRVGVTYVSF